MSSKSLIYRVLVLLSAALIVNQIACSKASFDADDGAKAQETSPEPEFVDTDLDSFDPADTGDSGFDDPVTGGGGTPTYDDPTPNDPNYPRCDILSNTGKCYRNTYSGNYSWYPVHYPLGTPLRQSQIERIDGYLNLQIFVNGSRTSYAVDRANDGSLVVNPTASGSNVIIEFCIY